MWGQQWPFRIFPNVGGHARGLCGCSLLNTGAMPWLFGFFLNMGAMLWLFRIISPPRTPASQGGINGHIDSSSSPQTCTLVSRSYRPQNDGKRKKKKKGTRNKAFDSVDGILKVLWNQKKRLLAAKVCLPHRLLR